MTDLPQDATCQICGTEIEATRKVGVITHVLDPCGHQIDEAVHEGLAEE